MPFATSQRSRTELLFLAGDVMTGRGIDQALSFPGDPTIAEAWVRDARDYVRLAEQHSGPIPRPIGCDALWGELSKELARRAPAARIANLETSITRRGAPWPGKGVCYRMTPENASCLSALGLDVCTLANNHVLDFGLEGLEDTLATLAALRIQVAGAGRDVEHARRPAVIELARGGRIVVLSVGSASSGIPEAWSAASDRPGVELVSELSEQSLEGLCARIEALDRPGDVVVVSIHWGSNWGHQVPLHHSTIAHRMIDAGADVVHGHSSHHPRPIEVYRERLILYGCGDLVNDYEGIEDRAHAPFRGELALAYFPELDAASGALVSLAMSPLRIRTLRLERATADDAEWLAHTLDRACERFGTRVERAGDGSLALRWERG